jgi:hypothetical protein
MILIRISKEEHRAISLCADGRGRCTRDSGVARYEGQYTIYNWEEEDDPAEMLDRRFLALSILFVTSFISTAFHEYYS